MKAIHDFNLPVMRCYWLMGLMDDDDIDLKRGYLSQDGLQRTRKWSLLLLIKYSPLESSGDRGPRSHHSSIIQLLPWAYPILLLGTLKFKKNGQGFMSKLPISSGK